MKTRVSRASFGLAAVLIVGLLWISVRSRPLGQGTAGTPTGSAQAAVPAVSAEVAIPAAPTAMPSSAKVAAAPGLAAGASEVLSRRFPNGRVREERLESLPDGKERWIQWIEVTGAYPQVRAELTFAPGGSRLLDELYYLADSVLVERPADLSPDQFAARLRRIGLRAGPQYTFSPAVRVYVPEPLKLDSVPEALSRIGAEEPRWQVRPDHLAFSQAVPNDFDPRELWALNRVNAASAWEVSTGANTVVVAIIDSGISRQHADLSSNIWQNPAEIANGLDDDSNGLADDLYGWDFAGSDNDSADQEGHGTHVAGIIGATGNNGVGVTGVNWRVKIMGLRTGDASLSTSAVIQATDYAIGQKLKGVPVVVINNSYTSTAFNSLQRDSIQRARDADILFVAAAGNDSRNIDQSGLLYPIGYSLNNIVGVASTDLGDTLSDFSNFGASTVHVAAPGSAILSTLPQNGYGVKDGTSMAAPLVTGALALLRAAEPTLGALQLKNRLLTTAAPLDSLNGRVSSGGRLDLQRMINPTGSLPRVTALAPSADVYGVESAAQSVSLSVRGSRVSNGIEQTEIPVSWSKVSGPGSVTFTDAGPNRVSASFSAVGLYRLRASATAGGQTATLDRSVAVGAVAVPSTNLLAQWKFGEPSGPPLDSSGQGRNGVLIDGPVRDAGPFGTPGLRFNGTLSAMQFSAPAPTQVTLVGWVYMDSQGNSIFPRVINTPAYYLFVGRDGATGLDGNSGTVKFLSNWTTTDGVWHSPPGLLSNGVWYHVAATYDSTKGLRELPHLFLNGLETEVGAQTPAAGTVDLAPGTGYLGNNEERTRALAGRLADVRIYGRTLPPEEIAYLARESVMNDLKNWEVAVQSATASTVVVGLRRPDGRIPGSTLTTVWQQITGPGAPSLGATNGSVVTLNFSQAGTHTLTFDLFEGGVMQRRQVDLVLPGVVAPPIAPGFVRAPASRTVASGSNVILDVEASGTPPLTYQWLFNGVPITGQTLSQLLITAVRSGDSGNYAVRVSNLAGTATSAEATLTVLDPPSIVTQPQGQLVAAGSRVELKVVAAGSPTLTYQWQRAGVPIQGATSPTYVIDAIVSTQTGSYSVVVSNSVGTVTSNGAFIEVLEPPAIVFQPSSQTVVAGRTLVLDVSVSGTVPYTFAWFKNGVQIPNEVQPSLRFTTVRLEDAGTYTFRVTNAVGSATTVPIVLTVVSPPMIVKQPVTVAVALGKPATFTVEVTGTAPITYQWQRNSAPLAGETGPQLAIPKVGPEHVGSYTVVVSNSIDSVRSSPAYLDIVPLPSINQHPGSATVALGGEVTLEVTTSDPPGSIFYRWWHNGTPLANSNSSRLTLPSVGVAQAGLYLAELTNSGGTILSKPAVVGVTLATKTAGSVGTRPEWQNIVHPNGNAYDQFLLEGTSGALTADTGQISRMSFVDPQGDIVQVELAGKGTLTVLLESATGPAVASLYNQPGVLYMQGQATLVLAGSDESTHMSVYSVGPANNPGAVRPDVTYEGWASVRALGVHSSSLRVSGLRMGNARFEATTGATGLWAQGVRADTVFLSDIAAFAAAQPVLAVSLETEVGITGGSLLQPNGRPIVVDGVKGIRLREGASSTGQRVGPLTLQGRLERNGVDVSNTIVLPSS
ncbi:MAG: S8 family serine peptidase [Opitutaceae bacterium]